MYSKTVRPIAIITGPDTYVDHLGVICYLLDIPLLITEEETYATALAFYPQLRLIHKPMQELSLEFLAEEFTVIFESGKFWMTELDPFVRLIYQKALRFVYCPHGNSDKGHSIGKHVEQDIVLFYGEHMLSLLKKTGAAQKIRNLVRIGNIRLLFYNKYKQFYIKLVENQVLSHLALEKKTILYAPTWQDGENPTSFFQEIRRVVSELQEEFNLIIKLHPFLEAFHPAQVAYFMSFCEERRGLLFLRKFPTIYPLLEVCDLYLGDYSSIGYDFLFFDRPLYFFAGEGGASAATLLHSCGLCIPAGERLDTFIRSTLERNQEEKRRKRQEVYAWAFGEEKPFSLIREELLLTIQ